MGKKEIFLVEDESIVAMELSSRLNSLGYKVVGMADNGKDAIKGILDKRPDIIFMDINIKGDIDGIKTAAKVKEVVDIPIIFLTAYADDETLSRAKLIQPYGYIIKPFEERALRTTLEISLYRDELQKKIRNQEKWLAIILKNIADAVIATDENGLINYINYSASELIGIEKDKALGEKITDVFELLGNDFHPISINMQFLRNDEKNVEALLVSKNNKNIPIMVSSSSLLDDNNNTIGSVITFQNLTKVKETEKKYRTLVDNSPAVINIYSSKRYSLFFSKSIEKVLGYKPNEFLENPKLFTSLIHPEDLQNSFKITPNIFEEQVHREYRVISKDGSLKWLHDIIVILEIEQDEVIYQSIITDITERKQYEIDLIIAKEKAQESDKLKSSFLSQMSHEIRTPMNFIVGFTSVLEEEMVLNENKFVSKAINGIKTGSKRIIKTMEAILEQSKFHSGSYNLTFTDVNLHKDICAPIFEDFKQEAFEKGLEFNYFNNFQEQFINTDKYCINQTILNLVENAIKYTDSGSVNVVVEKQIHEELVIKVSDTGKGIKEEYMQKLFKPFSQEDHGIGREYEGNGLGLALVKNYCTAIGADIYVESEVNVGSTFTVVLKSN